MQRDETTVQDDNCLQSVSTNIEQVINSETYGLHQAAI